MQNQWYRYHFEFAYLKIGEGSWMSSRICGQNTAICIYELSMCDMQCMAHFVALVSGPAFFQYLFDSLWDGFRSEKYKLEKTRFHQCYFGVTKINFMAASKTVLSQMWQR